MGKSSSHLQFEIEVILFGNRKRTKAVYLSTACGTEQCNLATFSKGSSNIGKALAGS